MLAGRLLLPGNGFTTAHGYPLLSLGDGPTLRAAAGSVLYLALIALLSLGIATPVRDSAAAIGVVLGLLYLFPIISASSPTRLAAALCSRSPRATPAWPSRTPRPAQPAHRPVGRPRRARRLGRRRAARRRCTASLRDV